MPDPTQPRRNRKRVDRNELPDSFLPHGNRKACIAYLCAIVGLIPGLGLLLGPLAVIYGRIGYVAAKKQLSGKGIGHSFVSMLLGGLETIATAIGLALIGWHLRSTG